MTNTINTGDRVAYSRAFCRSIGELSGDIPHARGTVTETYQLSKDLTIATIKWDGNPDIPGKVNAKNLVLVSKLQFEH